MARAQAGRRGYKIGAVTVRGGDKVSARRLASYPKRNLTRTQLLQVLRDKSKKVKGRYRTVVVAIDPSGRKVAAATNGRITKAKGTNAAARLVRRAYGIRKVRKTSKKRTSRRKGSKRKTSRKTTRARTSKGRRRKAKKKTSRRKSSKRKTSRKTTRARTSRNKYRAGSKAAKLRARKAARTRRLKARIC